MLMAIKGIYRNGKVELQEIPSTLEGEVEVIVTFLTNAFDTLTYAERAALRASLETFSTEWDRPEMDIYDE